MVPIVNLAESVNEKEPLETHPSNPSLRYGVELWTVQKREYDVVLPSGDLHILPSRKNSRSPAKDSTTSATG